ncbi:MAG: hypothetical protein OXD43_09640 [Bacteroidetes bacterium]|nr:hypothetical protein [Bacteroidota bacterium]
MNYLIACGGTGAHVMLAMVRLHILGEPFAFFDTPVDDTSEGKFRFPNLFLVDQDDGDRGEKNTAWQKVRNLIEAHPGRYHCQDAFGLDILPNCKTVEPTPKGWANPPYNTCGMRFKNSQILPLILSERQQDIDFSRGFMASPAVGSLIFRFKELDVNGAGSDALNRDTEYARMLNICEDTKNRIVITGSGVGGTGSSVAPTLADLCAKKRNPAMAVMLHTWFTMVGESEEDERKAGERNNRMRDNAESGLAFYGEDLSKCAASVLVGVPEEGLVSRKWEADNQQPYEDSYAHAIAALAAIHHFQKDKPFSVGLYGMSASNPSKLTGDLKIGESGSTLRNLVDKGTVLVHIIDLFIKVLANADEGTARGIERLKNRLNYGLSESPRPVILQKISSVSKVRVRDVISELEDIKKVCDESLKWLSGLGVERQTVKAELCKRSFILEIKTRERLRKNPFTLRDSPKLIEAERVALSLFYWIARWIKEEWRDELVEVGGAESGQSNSGGYWPTQYEPGVTPQWGGDAGQLKPVEKAPDALSVLFEDKHISPNGWPHPIAVAEEFKFQVERQKLTVLRKLEMLLVGRARGVLKVEEIKDEEDSERLTLARLIKEVTPELATHHIIHSKSGKVFGFNSPYTLLCPAASVEDNDWGDLWEELTDYAKKRDWKESESWGALGSASAKTWSCIAGWVKRLAEDIPKGSRLVLVDVLSERCKDKVGSFGIAEHLSIRLGDESWEIPLPVEGESTFLPDGSDADGEQVDELIKRVPEFKEIGGFKLVKDFRMPGLPHPVHMIWKRHLDEIQKQGKIFAWGRNEAKNQIWIKEDLENTIYVDNIRVIDIDAIKIRICVPLEQQPVPGSKCSAEELIYPDIPLRPDYIGLVVSPDKSRQGGEGEVLIDNLTNKSIETIKREVKDDKVCWTLNLRGRSKPVKITVRPEKRARAHWMIWPNFRTKRNEDSWRAYYVYSHSTQKSLEVRTIYENSEKGGALSRLQSGPPEGFGPSHPVKFDVKKSRHVGGPPVALCAYDHDIKEDVGIYLIALEELSKADDSWKLAVDFGTSHTVAAVEKKNKEGAQTVDLAAELVPDIPDKEKLSLHISENWPNEPDPAMQLDTWRPTYSEKENGGTSKSLLSSDLWATQKLDTLESGRVEDEWEPMTHYAIPNVRLRRSDGSAHVLSGFKWETKQRGFKGKEPWLRKCYLRMAIEVFVADIIRKLGQVPKKIEFTFTYPLRGTSTRDTEKYKTSIQEVLKCIREDLGCEAELVGSGLYSESHAAKKAMGTRDKLEVKLVADLGGRTLDILLSCSDGEVKDGKRNKFGEVADSVKLGGHLLLETLAKKADSCLPKDRGWKQANNSDACLMNLRAWMRSMGSEQLFHIALWNSKSEYLGLEGFENSAEGRERKETAVRLIHRYFWFITDFLARSLVAYIGKDIWPKLENEQDRKDLKIVVQIQGNGWRLWYDSSDYIEIQSKIKERIQRRASDFWNDVGLNELNSEIWHEDQGRSDPKLGPIKNAVGEEMSPNDVLKRSHKFPLAKLVFDDHLGERVQKNWFDALPFENVEESVELYVWEEIDPPLLVDYPLEGHPKVTVRIDDNCMRKINKGLKDESSRDVRKLDAPVAALIWENAFNSENIMG